MNEQSTVALCNLLYWLFCFVRPVTILVPGLGDGISEEEVNVRGREQCAIIGFFLLESKLVFTAKYEWNGLSKYIVYANCFAAVHYLKRRNIPEVFNSVCVWCPSIYLRIFCWWATDANINLFHKLLIFTQNTHLWNVSFTRSRPHWLSKQLNIIIYQFSLSFTTIINALFVHPIIILK